MSKILVVDDSPMDRHLASNLLTKRPGLTEQEKQTGLTVVTATDGKDALTVIEREKPQLVLTDMLMPEMNGLELVEEIKNKYPSLPVILMTAHGSEEIAIQALEKGAASYVPKRNLPLDLLETVEHVLAIASSQREQEELMQEYWVQSETQFRLPPTLSPVDALIARLRDDLLRAKICGENELIRVAVALREALSNAILHGSLEVGSEMREKDEKAYYSLIAERQQQQPYRDRFVHVTARESAKEAVFTIRDQGRGFDLNSLPDPTDPANLERVCGRGLLLIRTFMDDVRHSENGSEIIMVKRRR